MEADIRMARALAYRAAWQVDPGQDAPTEVAMAKVRRPQLACSVIDRRIQIMGASAVWPNRGRAKRISGTVSLGWPRAVSRW
jgi:alkylation response protein AidB-like acyl-CoA dehydrogenase